MPFLRAIGIIAIAIFVIVAPAAAAAETAEISTITPSKAIVGTDQVTSVPEAQAAIANDGSAVTATGALRGAGNNSTGQLGLNKLGSETLFQVAGANLDWTAAATGNGFSCGIRAPGTLWCWGINGTGQLGLGDVGVRQAPMQVGTANTWASVSAGNLHACATQRDGSLWCWGDNAYGKLGTGNTTLQKAPVRITGAWKSVSVTMDSTCAVKTDGSLWCWGYNGSGQLGNGTVTGAKVPTQVGTAKTWSTVASGGYHTCAIQTDKTLWCWGDNNYGEVGNGIVGVQKSPVRVGADKNWKSVSPGYDSTCAVRTTGTLSCWGYGGQKTPQQIGTDTDWNAVASIKYAVCATKADTSLWCWGMNSLGQLGLGDTANRTAPVKVLTPVTVSALAGGPMADHTLVITQDTAAVNACADAPTTKAFASLGDTSDYSLVAGGDFEGPVDNWALTTARVVAGNETLGILPGANSLLLGGAAANAEVVSPPFCLNETHPHFRFVLKSNTTTGTLYTAVRFRPKNDPARVIEVASRTNLATVTTWNAAATQPLATRIAQNMLEKGGTAQLIFRTTSATNSKGGMQIDDVLVDPYRTR